MRFCDKCSQFDKRVKNCCKKGFEVVIGKTGYGIRPSKCKKKYKKTKPINWKEIAVDNFQMYIRYRDNWTCVVCGKHISPKEEGAKQLMHGGHYISRKFLSLLLDPKNCHSQCSFCNFKQNLEGVDARYTKYVINKYGIEILDYYNTKKAEIKKISLNEWKDLALFWEKKLKEIKKQKGYNNE